MEIADCIVYSGECKCPTSGFKNAELCSTEFGRGYQDTVKK